MTRGSIQEDVRVINVHILKYISLHQLKQKKHLIQNVVNISYHELIVVQVLITGLLSCETIIAPCRVQLPSGMKKVILSISPLISLHPLDRPSQILLRYKKLHEDNQAHLDFHNQELKSAGLSVVIRPFW